jgi:Spy/CpxP family protein refolding chaperone
MKPAKFVTTSTLIFLSGLLIGWIIGFFSAPKHLTPPKLKYIRARVYSKTVDDLTLTPEQQKQTAVILDKGFEKMRQLKIKSAPEVIEIITDTQKDIFAILNPKQKKIYQEICKQKNEKMRAHLYEDYK